MKRLNQEMHTVVPWRTESFCNASTLFMGVILPLQAAPPMGFACNLS